MSTLHGHGCPGKSTVGIIYDIYIDDDSGLMYECIGIYTFTTNKPGVIQTEYEWKLKIAESTGTSSGRIATIQLPKESWEGSGFIYSQNVLVEGVKENSPIDLRPSPEQMRELLISEISLTATNRGGIVTVFAIGGKPTSDYTMQIMVMEVVV